MEGESADTAQQALAYCAKPDLETFYWNLTELEDSTDIKSSFLDVLPVDRFQRLTSVHILTPWATDWAPYRFLPKGLMQLELGTLANEINEVGGPPGHYMEIESRRNTLSCFDRFSNLQILRLDFDLHGLPVTPAYQCTSLAIFVCLSCNS